MFPFLKNSRAMIGKDAIEKAAEKIIDETEPHYRAFGSPHMHVFEQTISKKLGGAPVLGIGNGLKALDIALTALGIGRGDEVIVPIFCSSSTIFPILRVGATPIFSDICLSDYALDPSRIEGKITERTKAIIVVHLFGQPALGTDEILKIAKRKSLLVIEDAVQAFGAKIKIGDERKSVGTLGDIGYFRFLSGKSSAASKKVGVLVFRRRDALYETVKKMRVAKANDMPQEDQTAAFLREFKLFDYRQEQREKMAEYYVKQLGGIRDIILPEIHEETENTWYRYAIRTKMHDMLFKHLFQSMSSIYRSDMRPYFSTFQKKYPAKTFPVSERVASEIIFLPIKYPYMMKSASQVVDSIKVFFQKYA